MKAPDKIYVDKFGQSIEGYIPEGCSLVTEYIRKDALLELLQNRNKEINGSSKALFRSQELQEIYWRIKEL